MKNKNLSFKIKLLQTLALLGLTLNAFGQEFQKPSEGKALVYFVRYQGAIAALDFKYFDGEKYLGRATMINYFVYECEPGEHVFWVATENREYIKGNLKANCVYVIEVRPYFRAVMASAKLYQIDPANEKALKKIDKVLNEEESQLKGKGEDQSESIKKGMGRYEEVKEKVTEMNPEWTFNCE